MKKVLSLLLLLHLFLFVNTLQSQSSSLDVGLEGGALNGTLYGNSALTRNIFAIRMAYLYGGFLQYNTPKRFSIRTGLYYESKGNRFESALTDDFGNVIGNVSIAHRFNFLQVPLLFRWHFGKEIQFFFNAGTYVGFLQNVVQHVPAVDNITVLIHQDMTTNFKKVEIGVACGAGIRFLLSPKWNFSMEFRNNLGLTNLSKVPVVNNGTIKTNALCFLTSFSYRIGK